MDGNNMKHTHTHPHSGTDNIHAEILSDKRLFAPHCNDNQKMCHCCAFIDWSLWFFYCDEQRTERFPSTYNLNACLTDENLYRCAVINIPFVMWNVNSLFLTHTENPTRHCSTCPSNCVCPSVFYKYRIFITRYS